jgi:hypothetical protein
MPFKTKVYLFGFDTPSQSYSKLKMLKSQKNKIVAWVDHKFTGIDATCLPLIDDLVVWCPGPGIDYFNEACGEPYFDDYFHAVKTVTTKKKMALVVTPETIDELPEFYEWTVQLNCGGIIMYFPSAFNSEQKSYILRFNRIPMMRVLSIAELPMHRMLGLPNTVGTRLYTWNEYISNIRDWMHQQPILRYIV